MLGSPEAAGRTTIVGKKPILLPGRKKAVAVAVRNVSGRIEAGGVSPLSCNADGGRNGTMLMVLHSRVGGHYRVHNRLGPPRERRGAFGRQRVNAPLDPGEPAVDIAQQNAGGIRNDGPNLPSAARAPSERGGTGERLLTIGGHDW
jgi:hypothetical protein